MKDKALNIYDKALKGFSAPWQDFLISIGFVIVFPLIPILIEFWIKGNVDHQSMVISAAMYAFSIGFSSRNKLTFGLCLFVGVIMAILYGYSFHAKALCELIRDNLQIIISDVNAENARKVVNSLNAAAIADPRGSYGTAMFVIAAVAIVHLGERYNMHVVEGKTFPDFSS